MREANIESKLVKWARATPRGILVTKGDARWSAGFPDRIFWMPGGSPVLIETKRPGGKPTKLQERMIARLKSLGYKIFIIESYDEGVAILTREIARASFGNRTAKVGTKTTP